MSNTLLKSFLILAGMAGVATASAEKSFVLVTNPGYMLDGHQYVFGMVGNHQNNWKTPNKNPLCYEVNEDNTSYTMVAKPNHDFTDKMIFTIEAVEGYNCGMPQAQHGGSQPVYQVTQGDKALAFNSTTNKLFDEKSNINTNIEFVPVTANIEQDGSNFYFQWHTTPAAGDHTNFQKINSISNNGDVGWSSIGKNGTWVVIDGSNAQSGNANLSYTSLVRPYVVVDSENLESAAQAIWAGLKWAECQNQPEEYQTQVNALELPDLSGMTHANLATKLAEEMQIATFNFAETITLTPQNAYDYNSTSTTSTFRTHILGTDGAFALLTAVNNANGTDAVGNMQITTENNVTSFNIYNGARDGNMLTTKYTISSLHPSYTVGGILFRAKAATAGQYITIDGVQTEVPTDDYATFIATDHFLLSGTNAKVYVDQFSVKLLDTGIPSEPTTTGWYEITLLQGSHCTGNMAAYDDVNRVGHIDSKCYQRMGIQQQWFPAEGGHT